MSLPKTASPPIQAKSCWREFLVPMRISQAALARHLGIPAQWISAIVLGKRSITAATAWLFAQAFNTTPEFWMRLQINYDLAAFQAYEEDRDIGRLIAYRIIYRFIPCHLLPHSQALIRITIVSIRIIIVSYSDNFR